MPELPEVETIKRIIEPQIVHQKITSIIVNNPQVIAHPEENLFCDSLTNQTIKNMSRRGKYLTIHFVSNDTLTVHLRMTGQLLVTPSDYPVEKHTHLIAQLSNGSQIRYIDVRRFGRFWYLKENEFDTVTGQSKLGLEPLDDNLNDLYLKSKLQNRKKTIKEMLHDQSVVAGIGNIYSDEILYASGIYPAKKCTDITDDEWRVLVEKIHEIIAWGIDTNKITPDEYLAGKGKEYRNMPYLNAYGNEGKPCKKCGAPMKKITIGGRSSTFCPVCQQNK